ncbi:MAG: glycoside hydrolase family 99-like domain-containing protein [Terracidiphilus sp.]
MTKTLTTVAYYLGQFHPIPENDLFWGEGFTEWHNVARARPLFPGHVQPVLPGKLGFYDLRCEETLVAQMAYANDIGIDAFCFWHYWFVGKRLLHRPLDDMLKLSDPSFRFMLGWANESWSGVWHGASDKVLLEQSYNAKELEDHAALIAKYIETGKYLAIDGCFPLVIYKPRQIPNAQEYLGALRERVHRISGAKLSLIGNWSPGRNFEFTDPQKHGLDAAVVTPVGAHFNSRMASYVYRLMWRWMRQVHLGPEVRRYHSVDSTLHRAVQSIAGIAHATVVTGWDNTPRSGRRGLVLSGYNEHAFRSAAVSALALEKKNQTPILFVKSWNEWAEGNIVEPVYGEQWSVGSTLREVLRTE